MTTTPPPTVQLELTESQIIRLIAWAVANDYVSPAEVHRITAGELLVLRDFAKEIARV